MDSETPSEESPNDDDDDNNNNSPTTKHIDDYIKNLFEVPTKNIELAFGLVLGLIKEQSTEIGYVKRAQSEALVRNDEIREHLKETANELVKENNNISSELQQLRKEHNELLESHEKANATVEELRSEIKVSQCNKCWQLSIGNACSHIVHQFMRRHWRSTFRDFTKSLSPRMIVRLITTTSLQLS